MLKVYETKFQFNKMTDAQTYRAHDVLSHPFCMGPLSLIGQPLPTQQRLDNSIYNA